jgi:hypothetical protein
MIERKDVTDLYWFWQKGKMTRKRNNLPYGKTVVYEQWLPNCEWNGLRFKNGFYNLLNLNMKSGKYNGQTKAEFEKNYRRVKDIFEKSAGDVNKSSQLARNQANRITDEWKALNRSLIARDMGQEEVFEVFFNRAYELGSVTKQDYRSYKLKKLGI